MTGYEVLAALGPLATLIGEAAALGGKTDPNLARRVAEAMGQAQFDLEVAEDAFRAMDTKTDKRLKGDDQ